MLGRAANYVKNLVYIKNVLSKVTNYYIGCTTCVLFKFNIFKIVNY